MKLLSPVNSLESAQMQIDEGADEIYVGLMSEYYKNYSFSGRGQFGKFNPDENSFEKIVELAHAKEVEVSLAANTPLFSDSLVKDSKIEKEYLNQIEKGIKFGADNIIVGDVGLLYQLGKMDLPVNLHASSYFDTMNIEQALFLKELGANRVVMTYQSTIDEIEALCNLKEVEIEVFGYMGCSFFNGACNMIHDMGEKNTEKGKKIGIPCKGLYHVYSDEIGDKVVPYLDAELGCALCSIYRLNKMGVDVIKIAVRDRNSKMIKEITSLFRKAIDFSNTVDEEEYHKLVNENIYPWWERSWCSSNKCKYRNNRITRSYIGK